MLCLMAHAAFVSITHHHPVRPESPATATSSFIANDGSGTHSAPDFGGDCVSCRLQRNFVSNIATAAVVVQPLEQDSIRETILCAPYSKDSSLHLFGRGPPA